MTDILLFSDHKKSHLIPTFRLAQNLKEFGYKVGYIGTESVLNEAEKMGFDSYKLTKGNYRSALEAVFSGAMDRSIKSLNPKILLATAHNPLEILAMYYKYRIKTILIWSHFPIGLRFDDPARSPFVERARGIALEQIKKADPIELSKMINYFQCQGVPLNALEDLVAPCSAFGHFITCSKALHFESVPEREGEVYLGPCLSEHGLFEGLTEELKIKLKQAKAQDKPLIYCSMGSWADGINGEKALSLFRFLVNAMRNKRLSEVQLLIASGNFYDELKAMEVPENVIVKRWMPQARLLEEVDLAIIHGGLGSVKECINEQVPMLVSPLGLDQFDNARMITTHGLGKTVNIDQLSEQDLIDAIMDTMHNHHVKQQLAFMKAIFEKDSASKPEVAFVENLIGDPKKNTPTTIYL